MKTTPAAHTLPEQAIAWALALLAGLALTVCAYYLYVVLVVMPDPGFLTVYGTWEVTTIDPSVAAGDLLRVHDELLTIGDITREQFVLDRSAVLFAGLRPGDHITLTRWRAGAVAEIDWIMPVLSDGVLAARIAIGLPGVIFCLLGLVGHLLLRPRNQQWLLLVSFCYVTAMWLASGVVSSTHQAGSSFTLHAVTWPLVAIILDLHLTFPRSLWQQRSGVLRPGLYALALAAAALEFLSLTPQWAYLVGLSAAIAVSLGLLVYHLVSNASAGRRRAARLMVAGISLAFGPGLLLAVLPILLGQRPDADWEVSSAYLSLFLVPVLPFFYTYAIYKRYLGNVEFRANRAISVYLFLVLVLIGLGLTAWVTENALPGDFGGAVVVLVVVVGFIALLAAIFGLTPFQGVIERYVLGIPPAPTHLVVAYASRLGTCLDRPSLVHLLRDEVLPGLLVRQSALLRQEADGRWQALYAAGIAEGQLPDVAAAQALLAVTGRLLAPDAVDLAAPGWVRLSLPLRAAGQQPGLWLLGRRDPDDFYAATEIAVLQALADQTAVALLNIRQAEDLHALYQANVNRSELERMNLAHELHDGPLNNFGLLAQKVDGGRLAPDFQATYTAAMAGLRQTVAGLRPIMLSYGLASGLRSLLGDLGDHWPDGPELQLEAAAEQQRYPEQVETHAYRIVQQACLNALRHAGARTIQVNGVFEAQRLDLTVADDGRGFQVGADLAEWLAQRHFGLAGMHERAALIGGELHIASAPGAGTRVRLIWPAAGSV